MHANPPAADRNRAHRLHPRPRRRSLKILGRILGLATFFYLANFYRFDPETEADIAYLKSTLARILATHSPFNP